MGGFFDGIVLHQLLRWHHVVSDKVAPTDVAGLELNTLADGIFHGAMWLIVLAGVLLLARDLGRRPQAAVRRLIAGSLIGFGAFNVVDEVIFHTVLGLHHIRPGTDYLFWDLAFTAWGLAMIAAGWWLVRGPGSPADAR